MYLLTIQDMQFLQHACTAPHALPMALHPPSPPLQFACAQVAHAWSGLRRSGVGQALLDSLGYGGGEAQEVGDALLGMAASYHGCVSDDEEL